MNLSHPTPKTPFFGSPELAFQFTTVLLAFCMPLISKGLMLPIFLWVLAWFFVPKHSLAEVWKPLLVFAGIYFFHLIGMLYTSNLDRGFDDLEQKLSLLAFPIILGTAKARLWQVRSYVLAAFASGTVVALVLSFIFAQSDFRVTGLIEEFYASRFSYAHHPSYFALYINTSLAVILLGMFKLRTGLRRTYVLWFAALFLALGLVFVASKMGFIQFAVLVLFILVYAFKNKQLITLQSLGVLVIALLFGLFLAYNDEASQRLSTTVEVVSQYDALEGRPEVETNTARLYTWRLSADEIKNHPLGVGTGDINDVLVARYLQEGLYELARTGLNPHNNFLQIALALGIPALLWFLFSLAYPLPQIWRNKDWLYAFVLGSMLLHMMVESMLELQSGVVYFAFFNALLYFSAWHAERSNALLRDTLP